MLTGDKRVGYMIRATSGSDTIGTGITGSGDDVVRGLGGNDWIDCLEGSDRLLGDSGDDTLIGSGGSDGYLVDHAGDQVIESVGGQ
jgi:serralysin